MKIAMHEITTRDGTFEEHLAAYEKTGWKHFEINFWKAGEFIEKEGIEATVGLVKDHGLTCIAATGLGLSTFADETARAKDIEQVKQYGESMQALGCRPLVTGSNRPDDLNRENYSQHLDTLAEHIGNVAAAGAPFGVQLAIEVNWCSLCRSYSTAAELIRRVDRDDVGLIWDPAHFHSTPSRLSDLELSKGKILHAHLNDMNDTFVEVMDINGDRVLPGAGIVPMREWTDKVTECGFDGWHSIELFNAEFWKDDLETICRKCMDSCRSVWPEAEF